jgi:drug/metabolite transporter (DMT)-like permease
MLPAFLTTILFATSAVSGARVTRLMGGSEANFWRLALATLFLALYAHVWGAGMSGPGFAILFVSGAIGFGFGDLALFQAYPRIGSRLTILLVQCLASPFAAITEWLWLDHAPSALESLCGLTVLAGVTLALAPGKHLEITRRQFAIGVTFGVLAACGQGLGAVLSRKAYAVIEQGGGHIDGISAAYQRILGGLLLTGIFVLILKRREAAAVFGIGDRSELPQVNPDRWRKGWPLVIVNALAGPTLGVSCYQWALLQHGTGLVLPIAALTPIVVIPLAYHFEGERPTQRSLVGSAIAVAGAVALAIVVAAKTAPPGE